MPKNPALADLLILKGLQRRYSDLSQLEPLADEAEIGGESKRDPNRQPVVSPATLVVDNGVYFDLDQHGRIDAVALT